MLNDAEWSRIKKLLPRQPTPVNGQEKQARQFIEGVLYIARRRCPWRDLPGEFGKWNSVYVRFVRWEKKGIWRDIAAILQEEVRFRALRYRTDRALSCPRTANGQLSVH